MIAQVYELWETRACAKCGGFSKLQQERWGYDRAEVWACQNGHREYVNIDTDAAAGWKGPGSGTTVHPGGRASTYRATAERAFQFSQRSRHGRQMAAQMVRERGRFLRPLNGGAVPSV